MAVSATITGSGTVGHRKSTRWKEYIRYTVNQPDPDEPVVDYALATAQPGDHPGQAVWTLTSEFTGATETPVSSITLSPTTSADPVAEDVVTATHSGGTIHTIYHSKRGCMVTRWKTYVPSLDVEQEWLIRGWHEGLGTSLNPNIRWHEKLFTAAKNSHNPTTGGQALITTANDDPNDLITSRLLYHQNASGGPGVAFAASACNPLEWDVLGLEGHTPHGGSATATALWWRHRVFQWTDPFYGGRETISRVTAWFFIPDSMHESEFGGNVYLGGSTARLSYAYDLPLFTWNIFDEAYWYDCSTDTLTAIGGWTTVPDPGQVTWEAYTSLARNVLTGEETPSPFSSGYGAIVLRRASDDYCVAVAARIGGDPVTVGQLGRYTLPIFLHAARTFHGTIPTTPDLGGKDTVTAGITAGSFTGVEAGWHGMACYVFTGAYDDCATSLQELYTSGVLDELPDAALLPSEVTTGTDLAIPAGPHVEYTRALQMGLGLRP